MNPQQSIQVAPKNTQIRKIKQTPKPPKPKGHLEKTYQLASLLGPAVKISITDIWIDWRDGVEKIKREGEIARDKIEGGDQRLGLLNTVF